MKKNTLRASKGKVVFMGFFLNQSVHKYNFWLGQINQIKKMFSKCIVIEGSMAKTLPFDSELWETYRFPKEFHTSKWSIGSAIYGIASFIYLLLTCRNALFLMLKWEKAIINSYGKLSLTRFLKLWLKILCGLGRFQKIVRKINFTGLDLLVVFAYSPAGTLMRSIAEKAGCKTIISEVGELPNTMIVSELGLYDRSWPSLESAKFAKLPVTSFELSLARKVVQQIATSRQFVVGGRFHEGQSNGHLYKQDKLTDRSITIYVNGIYPTSLGLEPRNTMRSKQLSPKFSSNLDLLNHVAEIANRNGWQVIYKDHPLLVKHKLSTVIKETKFDNVQIVNNDVNIHDILDVSDVMVSLASKSTLLALARGIPVCLAGPSTIPKGIITKGVVETTNIEEGIKTLLKNKPGERVDMEQFTEFICRLRKFYLYPYPDFEDEGTKSYSELWNDIAEYLDGERRRVSIMNKY